MTTFTRYLLFQIPGWVLTVALAVALRSWFGLPIWAGVALFVALLVKDFVVYPFVRVAYETGVRHGVERLVGEKGVVRRALAPEGYVKVAGELWQARGSEEIGEGSKVRVVAAEGMVLIVEPFRR